MHEHREDVESDFSAIHRISDPTALPPQRFIDFAVRLGSYPGAVQAALRAPEEDGLDGDRTVGSDTVTLAADPVLADLIELD